MQKRSAIVYLFVTFVLVYFLLHGGYMNEGPGGINHVAQAKAMALTQGFVDNHLDFSTTELSEYQPISKKIVRKGYTSEVLELFPVHSYAPALWISWFGGSVGNVLKWYHLLWGFVGLYFLYMLALRYTNHVGKSLFVVLFVASLPSFTYFHSGFSAVIPALSSAFIGIYFVYRYSESRSLWQYLTGIGFLIFASLTTHEFTLALLVVSATGIQEIIAGKDSRLKYIHIPLVIVNLGLLYLYIFQQPVVPGGLPAYDPALFEDTLIDSTANAAISDWKLNYFSTLHLVLFVLIIVGSLVFPRHSPTHEKSFNLLWIWLFALALVTGLFTSQRMQYEPAHFLAVGFLPLSLLLLGRIAKLPDTLFERFPKIAYPVFVVLLLLLLGETNWTQLVQSRKKSETTQFQFSQTYNGSDELLAHLKIPKDALLVLAVPKDCTFGNDLLMKLGRKGLVWRFGQDPLKVFGTLHPDFLIVNRETEELLRREFPSLFGKLHLIGTNNTVHVYAVTSFLQ